MLIVTAKENQTFIVVYVYFSEKGKFDILSQNKIQIDSFGVFISFVEESLNVVVFISPHINPELFIIPQCLVPKDQFGFIKERENMSRFFGHILSLLKYYNQIIV